MKLKDLKINDKFTIENSNDVIWMKLSNNEDDVEFYNYNRCQRIMPNQRTIAKMLLYNPHERVVITQLEKYLDVIPFQW